MIEVKIDGITKWQVNEYTFTDPQMGIRSISMTVKHPSMWAGGDDVPEVADFNGAYVEYDGETYNISSSKPTAEKSNTSLDYIYTLIFKGEEDELTRRKVRNLALVSVDNYVSQGTIFSISATISQFANLIENNLTHYFGDKWSVNLSALDSDTVQIDVNNMFLWDLLVKTYEYYGVRWNIRGNVINIGVEPEYIEHVFDYGAEGGLVKITRTAPDMSIVNRLSGMGGTRNVPMNYFTSRYSNFPPDPNPINDTVYIRNIMPKVFRDSVIAGTLPYIDYVEDAALVASDGVKEDALEPNEDIYPSIAGVEVAGLGRIDQIIAAEVPEVSDPDDDLYLPTFDIWIKDIGFDLSDNQYTASEDAKIHFTTGELAGYEFVILAEKKLVGSEWKMVRKVEVDTTKFYGGVSSQYKVTLIKSDEELDAYGQMLPNAAYKAQAGDSFVILNIEMPQVYVELAEQRVQDWLEAQLDEIKVEKPTYAIEPMDQFFEDLTEEGDGKTIREKIKSGNKLSINNTKITGEIQELYINQVTIQYGGLLPKYTLTVTDKVQVQGSAVQRLKSSIDGIMARQNLTELEIASFLREISRKYLRKDIPDTASGLITFLKGIITAALEVGGESLFRGLARVLEGIQFGESFIPGLTGLGGLIDGSGNAELDALSLRKWLEVPELRYNRVEVTIGDKWSAPGAGIIESVDTENKVIKLKLEEGEIGTFDVDDICMGIYHSLTSEDNATSNYDDSKGNRRFAGFATSYFRIIQVMDNQRSTLRYELRHISESHPNPVHPSQFMHAVAYGNFTNAGRQTSNYQTRTYTRYLKGVRDWEFTLNNIAAQFGNLDNLNVFGLEMRGYSIYLNNVYFTGIIYQLSQQIQDELNKQQIGGKNLLREYDIRFGFKYWGGTGEFIEVNLDTLQNQPYLNVSPAQILWVFPEREADVNVESNTSWTASTPNPWLSLSKTTGVGADSIILSSNTLFSGRLDRLGSVIITPTGLTNRTVQLTQKGRPEFVSIQPSIHSSEEGEVLTISGKTNSSKLTFSLGAGTIDISLPTTFIANGNITADNANVEGDPGATSEFNFSIEVTIPVNLMVQNISRNLIVTTAGGQTGMCIITQGKARVVHELLSTPDSKLLVIGENIFINVKHN